MAKQHTETRHSTPVPHEIPTDPTEANQAAPKKTRNKGVKYTTIVDSSYKTVDGAPPTNPLDQEIVTHRGGLEFPGVIFETTLLGSLVKIPAKCTAIKAPTLRQLVAELDKLYS